MVALNFIKAFQGAMLAREATILRRLESLQRAFEG